MFQSTLLVWTNQSRVAKVFKPTIERTSIRNFGDRNNLQLIVPSLLGCVRYVRASQDFWKKDIGGFSLNDISATYRFIYIR